MAEYVVGKGVSIHSLGYGSSLSEGQAVPASVLEMWGEGAVREAVTAGTIIAVGETAPRAPRRAAAKEPTA